jgi:hypothetical protein
VPSATHPIFPGSSASLSLTEEQFVMIRDTDHVFSSVIRNDELLQDESDLMSQFGHRKMPKLGLTDFHSDEDVYHVGSICKAKAVHDS